ncbi:Galactoside-binding lectin [Seminavis robusta]|uniref:Galectin n=1 Tax=Seminavis robusta TaxID=568900 RepID=A0A9N8H971_9STRA|nr:Galactoside-binding lectin [Seminavis robusta]|eukprot:Sro195_g083270.1 Galactoside-binding lectin (431) ;mRNA; r:73478-75007
MSALDDDGEMDDGTSDETDEDSSEDEDAGKSTYEKREKKLKKMRDEVEAKMSKKAKEERESEAKRLELLAEADDEDGPSLLRRKRADSDEMDKPKTDLLAHLTARATPPHDFSARFKTTMSGQRLFPPPDLVSWAPSKDACSPDDGALTLELEKFNVTQANNGMGNNTILIKCMAPEDSRRFSINIAGPDHDDFHSVLFHFNPRQRQRGGQLVLNNKQEGIWGTAVNVPLNRVPLMFGQPAFTLIIQINGEGFDVFVNDEKSHIARLEHRRALPTGNMSLFLNFPATDDYNKPENWVVYKVWWGNKPPLARPDLVGLPGFKSFSSLHPRKLFISKLKKVRKDTDVDMRRAEFERAFRKYGGARGVTVIVPKNQTFCFVEFDSERMADLALEEMSSQYKINRARRTKHEALEDERVANQKKKEHKSKSGWD